MGRLRRARGAYVGAVAAGAAGCGASDFPQAASAAAIRTETMTRRMATPFHCEMIPPGGVEPDARSGRRDVVDLRPHSSGIGEPLPAGRPKLDKCGRGQR